MGASNETSTITIKSCDKYSDNRGVSCILPRYHGAPNLPLSHPIETTVRLQLYIPKQPPRDNKRKATQTDRSSSRFPRTFRLYSTLA